MTLDRKQCDEKQVKVRNVRKGSWILIEGIPYKVEQHDTATGSVKIGDPRGQRVRIISLCGVKKKQHILHQNDIITVLVKRPSPVNSPEVSTGPEIGNPS